MSCERQANKLGRTGAALTGVAALSSKASRLTGMMASRVNTALDQADRAINIAGQKSAPVTALAMKVIGPKNDQARASGQVVAGAAGTVAGALATTDTGQRLERKSLQAVASAGLRVGSALLPGLGPVRKAVMLTNRVTSALGTGLGTLSKTGEAGQVMQEKRKLFFFKSKEPVSLWKSSLTPLINQRDVLVRAKNIVSSQGLMFTSQGKTWHQGTMVVNMPGSGEKRTMTHLQSMNMPASHYYFNRAISKEQAVGISTGKIKAEQVPGYVGKVGAVESLCPAWANAKQALIRTHLHWPGGRK